MPNLPRCPEYYYGWGANAERKGQFPPYEEAKKLIKKYKVKSKTEWDKFRKSKNFPKGKIPRDPPSVYKNEWKGFPDWLGNNNKQRRKGYSATGIKYWSYKKARTFVRKFNFYSSMEFKEAKDRGKIPKEIPSDAADVYKSLKTWESWPKFLGHNNIGGAMANYNFMNFKKARRWARKSNIKTLREWKKAHSKGLVPKNIPCHSDDYYNKTGDWKGWNDFVGSYKGAHLSKNFVWMPFEEAKKWVRSKNFQNQTEFRRYLSKHKTIKIPQNPQDIYGEKLF